MADSRNGSFDLGKTATDVSNTVQDIGNNEYVHTAGYFVPGLGTAMLAQDAYHDFEKGDWGSGALNVGLAALDLVPYGSLVAGAVKGGAKAVKAATTTTKAVTKAPKAAKATPKPYAHLQPGSKDYTPPTVKPKNPKNGVVKPAAVAANAAKASKVRIGSIGGMVNAFLLGNALSGAGDGAPDAGLGAGATDRMLNGAVTRSAAFQAGASN
jgi:hypothetical protein